MRLIIFLSLLFALLFCTEQDRELLLVGQEANIDTYISANFADNKVIRNNGSNRIILKEGSSITDSLEYGDSLSFYYAGFIFETEPISMFATNWKAAADSALFTITDPDYDPMKVIFKKDIFNSGLTNGLIGMREGEQSIIIFSAKHGFNNESVYNIPKLSALIYEVQIDKITKNN